MSTAVAATIAEIIHFEIHDILKWLMSDLAIFWKRFGSNLFKTNTHYDVFSVKWEYNFYMAE